MSELDDVADRSLSFLFTRCQARLDGDDLVVDPLRALPRSMPYDAQLRQDNEVHEVSIAVLNTPNRIHLESPVPHHDGPASIDFLRRAD